MVAAPAVVGLTAAVSEPAAVEMAAGAAVLLKDQAEDCEGRAVDRKARADEEASSCLREGGSSRSRSPA